MQSKPDLYLHRADVHVDRPLSTPVHVSKTATSVKSRVLNDGILWLADTTVDCVQTYEYMYIYITFGKFKSKYILLY